MGLLVLKTLKHKYDISYAFINTTGNTTVREYAEDFYKSYNVGPKRGKYSCEKEVVPSGPDYLIINECKEYSKNKDGNMELSFISP